MNEPDSIETAFARATYAWNCLLEREQELVIELDEIRAQMVIFDRILKVANTITPIHAAKADPSQTAAEKIDSRQTIKEVQS